VIIHPGDLRLGLDYWFLRRDQLRHGRTVIGNPLDQETQSHIFGFTADYGLSARWSLSATLPLVINRSIDINRDKTDANLGNLSVQARLFFTPWLGGHPTNIQLALGSSLPIAGGVANVQTDKRNFASGTVDPIGQALVAVGLTPGFNINASFYTRQILTESSDGQQVGDVYLFVAGATYAPIGADYDVAVSLKYLSRGQDELDGVPFANSGGDWWYLVPSVSETVWRTGETPLRVWGQFELPVYQRVNGFQLTERWSVRLGLSWGITLFGHDEGENTGLEKPLSF